MCCVIQHNLNFWESKKEEPISVYVFPKAILRKTSMSSIELMQDNNGVIRIQILPYEHLHSGNCPFDDDDAAM